MIGFVQASAATLGEVIYGKLSAPPRPESEWARLVSAIAAGNGAALLSLYDRTARAVYTLLVRLTFDRETAEALLVDVYSNLRGATREYSPADSTVLAWVMRRARAVAIERLRAGQRKNHGEAQSVAGLIPIDMPDYLHVLRFRAEEKQFADALAALTAQERDAIEAVYFENRPAQSVSAQLRTGLRKLAGVEYRAAQCRDADLVHLHALQALSSDQGKALDAHRAVCNVCARQLESLRPVLKQFIYWPRDVLRPPALLRARLVEQVGADPDEMRWVEPPWEAVAPGISCKVLAADAERARVSLFVRLVPGGEYPPHTHAGNEELHLLHGELWIDERKIHAGDYNRAEPGTADKRVWSETGCACVLITSSRDILG